MELLEQNFLNTTTQFVVNSNTTTVGNIFIRDLRFQYASDLFNDDNTTATLTVNFDETLTVDRIALVGHNLKSFTAFYNGVTANTFALTSTANTTVSDYITNSETAMYLRTTPTDCTSVTFDMKSTIFADSNKAVGYMVISQTKTKFDDRVPDASGYSPSLVPKNVVHRLSDGGVRIQTIDENWSVNVGLDFITESLRNELKGIFDEHKEMVFVPFGTTTSWDEILYPCVWSGSFDFFKYSESASESGFSGSLTFLETAL